MATKEEEFKQRFAAVLADLAENGQDEPEAMWLIGSLAGELTGKVGARSWAEFKQTMSAQTYDRLLTDFQNEGNRQYREGDHKKAFAIQVLAMSLVASTQKDPQVTSGVKILDQMVEAMLVTFRQNSTPRSN